VGVGEGGLGEGLGGLGHTTEVIIGPGGCPSGIGHGGADGACRDSGLAAGSVTRGVAGTIGSKTNVNCLDVTPSERT
jgi:hypothetical protein